MKTHFGLMASVAILIPDIASAADTGLVTQATPSIDTIAPRVAPRLIGA